MVAHRFAAALYWASGSGWKRPPKSGFSVRSSVFCPRPNTTRRRNDGLPYLPVMTATLCFGISWRKRSPPGHAPPRRRNDHSDLSKTDQDPIPRRQEIAKEGIENQVRRPQNQFGPRRFDGGVQK